MLEASEAKRRALEVIQETGWTGIELITCETCRDNDGCEFAFDPYNTNGDCLESK